MTPSNADRNPHAVPPKDRLSCVKCEISTRQRLPRGRNGGRKRADTELKERIGRLEALVTSLSSVSPASGNTPAPAAFETRSTPSEGTDSRRDMTRYLGSSFWDNLSNEVSGLRDVLDEESDSETKSPESDQIPESSNVTKPTSFNFVLCGPGSFMMAPDAIQQPPHFMIEKLLKLYFDNVDPIFKVLHAPSVREHLQEGKSYLGHARGDPAVKALTFAIYYSAVITVDDDVCKTELGEEKATLRNKYRFAVEVSLAQADYVNSQDITSLQAFVLLLSTARADDNSRWTWSLVALAVRIAHALGLQKESTSPSVRPFEVEMRRRLWHSLRILDAHSSNDRGSDPVIPDPGYNTRLPLNINDVDISPHSIHTPIEREGITEMTLCLLAQSSLKHFSRLCFVPLADFERPPLDIQCNWDLRQTQIELWRQTMEEKYLCHCDETIPLHWFIKRLGEYMSQFVRLVAIRPMQRHPAAKPPRVDSSVILRLSTELLEVGQKVYLEKSAKQWAWYVWVQWHPLAVTLAELCSQTEGPLVETAWRAVDIAYNLFVGVVADTRRGMLWRPIEKLYKKAKANRAATQALGNNDVLKGVAPGSQPFDFGSDHTFPHTNADIMAQSSSAGNHMKGLEQLSVSDETQKWSPEALEPVDMAWLDWATFADDVEDFSMIDPASLVEAPWP